MATPLNKIIDDDKAFKLTARDYKDFAKPSPTYVKRYDRQSFLTLFHQYNEWVLNYKSLGRNDICSCGSTKKYKKCCMQNHQNADFLKFQKLTIGGYNINNLTEEQIVDFFNTRGQREKTTNDFGQPIEKITILF